MEYTTLRCESKVPWSQNGHGGHTAYLGQNLSLHPHLHCIVPGGGLTTKGKWKYGKNNGKYLFPVKAMSKVFRARFVQKYQQAIFNYGHFMTNSLPKIGSVCQMPFAEPER